MNPIIGIAGNYLQSILSPVLQAAGLKNNTTQETLNSAATSSAGLQPDNSQLSPFAQMISALQQLQQTDPAKYQQVAQQISTNLQSAAQTATSQGNTTAANQLNQLATDFSNASKTGQLPSIQDLAQAMGGHGHHHHHSHSGSSQASALNPMNIIQNSLSSSSSSEADALNPMTIIQNSLSSSSS